MTRSKVMSGLVTMISKDSVIFCIGKDLVGENKFKGYHGLIGIEDLSVDYFSIALGMAMVCDKKIIVICDDCYLLRYLSTMSQVGVSGCANLYIIVFKTNRYSANISQPTISAAIRSIPAVLFNFGLLVHDYSPYFKNKNVVKIGSSIFNKSLGPLIATIDVDDNRLYKNGYRDYEFDVFMSYLLMGDAS